MTEETLMEAPPSKPDAKGPPMNGPPGGLAQL